MAGVAVAGPAQADTACTIANFSPRSVTVGLTPVTATFEVATSGCTRAGWDAQEAASDFFVHDDNPQETFSPYSNSEAGAKDVIVSAYNSDYVTRERVVADGFRLLRRTERKGFNASPEPVRGGAPISVVGRLYVADWDEHTDVPYGSRKVAVQYRTPNGSYTTVKTVTAGRDGWVRTTVPATGTGVWRLSYGGNTTAAAAVAVGDSVQVVR